MALCGSWLIFEVWGRACEWIFCFCYTLYYCGWFWLSTSCCCPMLLWWLQPSLGSLGWVVRTQWFLCWWVVGPLRFCHNSSFVSVVGPVAFPSLLPRAALFMWVKAHGIFLRWVVRLVMECLGISWSLCILARWDLGHRRFVHSWSLFALLFGWIFWLCHLIGGSLVMRFCVRSSIGERSLWIPCRIGVLRSWYSMFGENGFEGFDDGGCGCVLQPPDNGKSAMVVH